ncbi:SMI1/KNR4 family protein [Herbidospora sp. RD11066]
MNVRRWVAVVILIGAAGVVASDPGEPEPGPTSDEDLVAVVETVEDLPCIGEGCRNPVHPVPGPDEDCAQSSAYLQVRPVGRKTTAAINREWRRLETWLKENAPLTYADLGEPATPEQIATAENVMGRRFPGELRASLLRHNGGGMSFFGHPLLPADRIAATWTQFCLADRKQDADPRRQGWDGQMIPFATDGRIGHLVLDSDGHDIGEFEFNGWMTFVPSSMPGPSPTYLWVLRTTVDTLRKGGRIGPWEPKVNGGRLVWEFHES